MTATSTVAPASTLRRRVVSRIAKLSWRYGARPASAFMVGTLRYLGALAELKRLNRRAISRHIQRRDALLCSYPAVLQIEHTTVCNLRCRMCSIVRPSRQRPPEHLTHEALDRLRPILPYVSKVKLNGGGEPFLVPDIEHFLQVFQSYGVKLNTTTNAMLITERIARIVGQSFSELIISMDGASAETYEMVRVNATFAHVVRALDRINAQRGPNLSLSIGFVAMRCNLHELPDLIQFAKQHHVSDVIVSWVVPFDDLPWTHDQDPAQDPEWANRHLARAREVAAALSIRLQAPADLLLVARPAAPMTGEVTNVDLVPPPRYGQLFQSNRVEGYCRIMYDRAMVLVDGRVKPCCHSLETMGSLNDQSFESIWNGPAYQSLRRSFARGVLPGSCSSCNFLRSGQLPGARIL